MGQSLCCITNNEVLSFLAKGKNPVLYDDDHESRPGAYFGYRKLFEEPDLLVKCVEKHQCRSVSQRQVAVIELVKPQEPLPALWSSVMAGDLQTVESLLSSGKVDPAEMTQMKGLPYTKNFIAPDMLCSPLMLTTLCGIDMVTMDEVLKRGNPPGQARAIALTCSRLFSFYQFPKARKQEIVSLLRSSMATWEEVQAAVANGTVLILEQERRLQVPNQIYKLEVDAAYSFGGGRCSGLEVDKTRVDFLAAAVLKPLLEKIGKMTLTSEEKALANAFLDCPLFMQSVHWPTLVSAAKQSRTYLEAELTEEFSNTAPKLKVLGMWCEWLCGRAAASSWGQLHQIFAHGIAVVYFVSSRHVADVFGALWDAKCFASWEDAHTWYCNEVYAQSGRDKPDRKWNTTEIYSMANVQVHETEVNLQRWAYITWLRAEAMAVDPLFQALVAEHANALGGKYRAAPMKGASRMAEKSTSFLDFTEAASEVVGWDCSTEWACAGGLCDIVRASITFEDADTLLTSARTWLTCTMNKDDCEVVRVQNSFHTSFNAPPGAYRDIKLNILVKVSGQTERLHICELQLILMPYLQVKKRMHLLNKVLCGFASKTGAVDEVEVEVDEVEGFVSLSI